ncbi:probable CDP-diacylglycerol--inositol 3-phosphatidyltransferase 2 isoform X2 [Brachypodium distachyon]|uniref:CDP-diacylglycerol--inositol 3-phosphatidyltransferase n=1 Tax=Brachypodium distachyon TaxID=15368 RepID=A0A0Q3L7H0_BRADI|nr:probable CDP-diacylglycerol--inositol 3-phosphatidyltransferase 2 isoform X2 [Brachypodium distachyon]KQK19113.1 hypothetical protein BRADI_1g46415v3 [Brachypodium distachyon]|eukprot:XP_024313397.1 probable CDP-diacylglycerol--inositol 3-phosphatidyltransferase 2 isoform X2 [Brachypodium distachyon]
MTQARCWPRRSLLPACSFPRLPPSRLSGSSHLRRPTAAPSSLRSTNNSSPLATIPTATPSSSLFLSGGLGRSTEAATLFLGGPVPYRRSCFSLAAHSSAGLPWNLDQDAAAISVSKERSVFWQSVPDLSMARPSAGKTQSVYLYIPNIIGYFRIIINFIAFGVCYSNRPLFAVLYFFSFLCDGLDGWFARKFNQGKSSHKDVEDKGNWLLKLYYRYRPFMAFCCVASEVLYIVLFLFADEKFKSLLYVCRGIMKQSPLIILVFVASLVGWALKQVINVIQMKTAADACVMFDPK